MKILKVSVHCHHLCIAHVYMKRSRARVPIEEQDVLLPFFLRIKIFDFQRIGPKSYSFIKPQCPGLDISFSLSPFHVIFVEASHWPSGHTIRSRPLIGWQPSPPPTGVCPGFTRGFPLVFPGFSQGFHGVFARVFPGFFFLILLFCFLEKNHATSQKNKKKQFILFLDKSRNLSKILSVLLLASVERFIVSRMQFFLVS